MTQCDPRLMILHRRRLKPEGPGLESTSKTHPLLTPSTSKKENPRRAEQGLKKKEQNTGLGPFPFGRWGLPQGLEAPVGDVQIRLVHLGSLRLRPKKKGGQLLITLLWS